MLKQRIITAIVLIALVLSGIFYLSDRGLSLAITGAMSLVVFEWSGLIGFQRIWPRIAYVLLFLALAFLSTFIFPLTLLLGLIGWILAIVWVSCYPKGQAVWRMTRIPLGLFIVLFAWQALVTLVTYPNGRDLLLLLLLIVWGADTGAYFAGRAFGKHLLAKRVSPKKTIEGLIGGIIFAFVLATLFAVYRLEFLLDNLPGLAVLISVTVLFSVYGDLFESMIKRYQGVKDSGTLLPGHGGLLDRFDSLLAAAPVFAAPFMWLAAVGV